MNGENNQKKFLFICGCPRSGTTALWEIVSSHERIALGCERYNNLYQKFEIERDLFDEHRFFDIRKGDTFYESIYEKAGNPAIVNNFLNLPKYYNSCLYYGDKFPFLYDYYSLIYTKFPNCKIIFIIRNIFDVANSYLRMAMNGMTLWPKTRNAKVAIKEWNSSLQSTIGYRHKLHIHIVRYENLFYKREDFEDLFKFLDLDITNSVIETYKKVLNQAEQRELSRKANNFLTFDDKLQISLNADFNSYRILYDISQ